MLRDMLAKVLFQPIRLYPLTISTGLLLAMAMSAEAVEAQLSSEPNDPFPSIFDLSSDRSEAGMSQVTSVSQLSDVQPTDWAFQALKSLVERYGCIVGYPDRTFRGNRATTRWEFAAGLNACLDKIQELIAAATADFVKKEDLETVKRLQEQFAAELAALRDQWMLWKFVPHQLTDNISITPGFLAVFNPNNNRSNDPIYIGTIKTVFQF